MPLSPGHPRKGDSRGSLGGVRAEWEGGSRLLAQGMGDGCQAEGRSLPSHCPTAWANMDGCSKPFFKIRTKVSHFFYSLCPPSDSNCRPSQHAIPNKYTVMVSFSSVLALLCPAAGEKKPNLRCCHSCLQWPRLLSLFSPVCSGPLSTPAPCTLALPSY